MHTQTTNDELLKEKSAAQLLTVSVEKLRKDRVLHRGPRFIKIDRAVRYRRSDLIAFINSCPSGGGLPQPQL